MAVCPMGIDTKIYYHKPLPDTHKIIFGAGGRLAHGGVRKGVIKVAETFLRAFPGVEDVELQLKVHHDCSVPEHPALLDPRVKLVKETYSERAMADWYHQLHSYVTMATGEGFGFMPLQAMACGRIVIANIAHGHAAYMKPHCVLETGYSLERAPDGLFAYKGYWYEPNEADVIKQMQFVYNQCRAVGVSPTLRRISDQAAYQASKFSWEVYEQRLTQLLQPYVLGGIDCTAMGQANVLR
jgi:glycosyltransferase involved in cell wall biosynthesis